MNEDVMDCDDVFLLKDWIRMNVLMMVGVLGGFEDRLKDFLDFDLALLIIGYALFFIDLMFWMLVVRVFVVVI